MAFVSGSAPSLPAPDLASAFAEPVRLAYGWADQPPWSLLALGALTLVLFALSQRE